MLHSAVYTISQIFVGGGWRGGVDETFPKFAEVSPKFWQNFMSSKFKKNHNTKYMSKMTSLRQS